MEREGIFAGDDPFVIARAWLDAATESEINDPNAMALATADAQGMPNVRMVLLKEIAADGFVFYTNYGSAKGAELAARPMAAGVLHWKSLRRQLRFRGHVTREEGPGADDDLRLALAQEPPWRVGVAAVAAARLARHADGRGGKGDGAKRPEPAAPTLLGRFQDHPD